MPWKGLVSEAVLRDGTTEMEVSVGSSVLAFVWERGWQIDISYSSTPSPTSCPVHHPLPSAPCSSHTELVPTQLIVSCLCSSDSPGISGRAVLEMWKTLGFSWSLCLVPRAGFVGITGKVNPSL